MGRRTGGAEEGEAKLVRCRETNVCLLAALKLNLQLIRRALQHLCDVRQRGDRRGGAGGIGCLNQNRQPLDRLGEAADSSRDLDAQRTHLAERGCEGTGCRQRSPDRDLTASGADCGMAGIDLGLEPGSQTLRVAEVAAGEGGLDRDEVGHAELSMETKDRLRTDARKRHEVEERWWQGAHELLEGGEGACSADFADGRGDSVADPGHLSQPARGGKIDHRFVLITNGIGGGEIGAGAERVLSGKAQKPTESHQDEGHVVVRGHRGLALGAPVDSEKSGPLPVSVLVAVGCWLVCWTARCSRRRTERGSSARM